MTRVRSASRRRVVDRFLALRHASTRSRTRAPRPTPAPRSSSTCCGSSPTSCRRSGSRTPTMDEHGYVFATIPATTKKTRRSRHRLHRPRRHVARDAGRRREADRPPELPRAGPRAARRSRRRAARSRTTRRSAEQIGNDIITASGTTLLGADNKAGVAEIVAAAEYLMKHPEIPHGAIRVGFTPDEEVGNGTKYFDVKKFGAQCAYTMDGETRGEIEMETFSADAITITFQGFNTHPGYAKGKMINAIKVAADFISRLPKDRLSPETTDGLRGLRPPLRGQRLGRADLGASCSCAISRRRRSREQGDVPRALAQETVADWPGAAVEMQGRRVLPQHEGSARPAPAGRRERARGDPPRRADAARAPDPRRHRRLAAVLHGAARRRTSSPASTTSTRGSSGSRPRTWTRRSR